MRAVKTLQQLLISSLVAIHAARIRTVFWAVQALVHGGRLSLTGIGRSSSGAGLTKHNIKRVDRLLGNRNLYKETPVFYRAIASLVIGGQKLAPHIVSFLRDHLSRHRGASPHTCDTYAYSFQLLLQFASERLSTPPSNMSLEQIDSRLVEAFLLHIETVRGCTPSTRNVRLAAIKSFFRYLEYREPAALEQVRQVLAIPFKKTESHLVSHLNPHETEALLDTPDMRSRSGIRDYAMLHLALSAGSVCLK